MMIQITNNNKQRFLKDELWIYIYIVFQIENRLNFPKGLYYLIALISLFFSSVCLLFPYYSMARGIKLDLFASYEQEKKIRFFFNKTDCM